MGHRTPLFFVRDPAGRFDRYSWYVRLAVAPLDPGETLDTVTQALENLRTGDRIVGIVTHLPQLAERLPTQIRVVKSQVGSHVEVTTE